MILKRIERELIRKTDVIELLQDLEITYKCYGNEVRIVCPFHVDARGYNLSINIDKKVFKCFSHHCEQNGYNLIDLVMRLMKTGDREKAVRYMAKLAGVELDFLGRNVIKEIYKKQKDLPFKENTLSYIREIKNSEGKGDCIYSESQIREWHENLLRSSYAMEYLIKKRKLKEWDIEKFYIGYDSMEKDLIFPVYSFDSVGCSRLKAVVRRTLSEEKAEYFGKYRIFGAKSECLYGLNEADGDELDLNHLILVEGVFDAIILQQRGYCAVAVMGTSITKYQMKILYELSPREISLCFDCDSKVNEGDDAGKNGMLRMINQFSKAGFNLDNISVIQISGYQDPDEVPEMEFRKMYENRISAIDFYLTQQIR